MSVQEKDGHLLNDRDIKKKLDMAGAKTFDLLVGVVLVLQCLGNAQGELTASNGKKQHLKISRPVHTECL